MSRYDEDYFERGVETGKSLYTSYRWMPEQTIRLAVTLVDFLNIHKSDKILDFGCAKGFLVYALRILGYEASGMDISEYAICHSHKDVSRFLHKGRSPLEITSHSHSITWDWVIAKDVLEHLRYSELVCLLHDFHACCTHVFVAVPLGEDGKYNVPAYELDRTHILRQTRAWWIGLFESCGFQVRKSLYRVEGIKDNWSTWENGNGFFVLRKK